MVSAATHAVIWLPGTLVWPPLLTFVPRYLPPFAYDWTPADQEFWHSKHPEFAPAFVLKHVVERPCPLTWLLLILTGLIALACSERRLRKNVLFCIVFVTLFITRCMGTFSGMQHLKMSAASVLQQLPWDSASDFKAFFLFWMVESPIWDYSYLSRFTDDGSEQGKLSLVPVSVANDNEDDDDNEAGTEAPRPISFRDAMVRLAYYHVIDNTLHMIWLRYLWPFGEGEPYTEYFNNSEALNILLVLVVIVWTCFRAYEKRATQEDDVEKRMDVWDVS
ncbi:hypothetical protein BKA66DRAFT_574231 [Pyrenochaeta sp. MPI-SDFR-AT-0127]|nr:hypothetical protein BKA66DRAFT_574231 [Pyrenochaeta sp. MPI-SDFR-AT-0127]